jgi:hypothetical protein
MPKQVCGHDEHRDCGDRSGSRWEPNVQLPVGELLLAEFALIELAKKFRGSQYAMDVERVRVKMTRAIGRS